MLIKDDHTIVVPDRPGNRFAYGLDNSVVNPHVGILFMIPGTTETLRVNGSAELRNDPELLEQLAASGKPAVLAIRVVVEECSPAKAQRPHNFDAFAPAARSATRSARYALAQGAAMWSPPQPASTPAAPIASPLSWRRIALVACAVGVAYAALSQYVLWLNDPVNAGAGFWPAAGVTLGALLLTPRRAWLPILLAVAVAEIAGGLAHGYPLGATAFWAAGNVIEPLVGAALIRRFRPHAARLAPLDNLLAFLALGVIAGPVVGASIGSFGTLLWFDTPAWTVWPKYVVGDALGVLVVAPLVLHASALRLPRRHFAEAGCFWLMLSVIGGLALLDWQASWSATLPYFLIPMLVWSALRSTIAATAAASFIVAQVANFATAHGWGPFAFAGDPTGHALTFLQVYLGIAVGTALILAAMVSDLVSRRELELQLTHRATHDPLTGLPNRTLVYERLERSLAHARDVGGSVGVLFCDLDGFKEINDTLGHEWGDRVLVATAERLLAASRPRDVVGRVGGDEFVIVCPNLESVDVAIEVAHRLEEVIRAPIVHDGESVQITASIGLAPNDGSATVDEIVREADAEMYTAKRQRGCSTDGRRANKLEVVTA